MCGASLAGTATRLADEPFKHGLQCAALPGVKESPHMQASPSVPDDVPQFYLPLSSPARPAEATGILYRPRVLAVAEVIFAERKLDLYHPQPYRLLVEAPAAGATPSWHTAERIPAAASGVAVANATWEEVPEVFETGRNLRPFERSLIDYLYADAKLVIY
jgi:hypothetical protein